MGVLEGKGDTLLEEAADVELLLRTLGGVEEEEGGKTWEAVMCSNGGWGGSNMNCLNSERGIGRNAYRRENVYSCTSIVIMLQVHVCIHATVHVHVSICYSTCTCIHMLQYMYMCVSICYSTCTCVYPCYSTCVFEVKICIL